MHLVGYFQLTFVNLCRSENPFLLFRINRKRS